VPPSASVETGATHAAHRAKGAAAAAEGAVTPDEPPANDQTLKDKVESEIFRAPDAPKGHVDVNAEDGVVTLRGELSSSERIEELEQATREVEGVRDVRSLLHLPDQSPPTPGST